jgi:protein tyrosine phosphatase domain-containing protein 1
LLYLQVTLVGEHLRQRVPGDVQCSMFCGGKRCKYESPDAWRPEEMAINGFYR